MKAVPTRVRLPQTCSDWRGCDQPTLPGRAVCSEHAVELDRRAEQMRQDHEQKERP